MTTKKMIQMMKEHFSKLPDTIEFTEVDPSSLPVKLSDHIGYAKQGEVIVIKFIVSDATMQITFGGH